MATQLKQFGSGLIDPKFCCCGKLLLRLQRLLRACLRTKLVIADVCYSRPLGQRRHIPSHGRAGRPGHRGRCHGPHHARWSVSPSLCYTEIQVADDANSGWRRVPHVRKYHFRNHLLGSSRASTRRVHRRLKSKPTSAASLSRDPDPFVCRKRPRRSRYTPCLMRSRSVRSSSPPRH